jgi:hypothetical protein
MPRRQREDLAAQEEEEREEMVRKLARTLDPEDSVDPGFPMDPGDAWAPEEECHPGRPPRAPSSAHVRRQKASTARQALRRTRSSRKANVSDAPNATQTPEKTRTLPDHDEEGTRRIVEKQLAALIEFCAINQTSVCPPAFTFEQHVELAQDFRDSLDESCNLTLCAVCAIPQAGVESVHIDDLPHKKLLCADEPSTPEAPRHGLTTCTLKKVVYCLQPDAVKENQVSACPACLSALKKQKIPKESLVRVDTGLIPRNPDPKLDLAPLRMLEERLVSPIRTLGKLVYLIKPDGGPNLPPQCRQQCSKGHVIAFPNVEPQQLTEALLIPLNEIPDILQVVMLNIASNEADLEQLASMCKAIHVRGREVFKWAVHLCRVRLALFVIQRCPMHPYLSSLTYSIFSLTFLLHHPPPPPLALDL